MANEWITQAIQRVKKRDTSKKANLRFARKMLTLAVLANLQVNTTGEKEKNQQKFSRALRSPATNVHNINENSNINSHFPF